MRASSVEQLDEYFRDRPKHFRGRVDQARIDAVASGQEPVLGEHLLGGAGVLRHVPLLELQPRDRLHERDQRRRLRETGLRIHDPDLDGSEPGLGTNVPPQKGRLGQGADANLKIDGLDPFVVGPVSPRHARPRKGLEENRPRRGESRVPATPERRVAGEGEEQWEMDAQPVVEVNRPLGVRYPDVHMERERRLPRGEVPHGPLDQLITARGGDLHLCPHRHGVRCRPSRSQAEPSERMYELGTQGAELRDRRTHRVVRIGRQLNRGLMRLGADLVPQRSGQFTEHVVDSLRQRPPPLGVDQHHLFLDADAIGQDLGVPLRPLGLRGHGVTPYENTRQMGWRTARHWPAGAGPPALSRPSQRRGSS